jgi:hypothetical protein
MKRPTKHSDGNYHISGKKYKILKGSRRLVWNHTAYKSPGGLTRDKLMMNKHGRIVSKKKHATAKKERRLEKAGFKPKKGTFKAFKKSDGTRKNKKSKK